MRKNKQIYLFIKRLFDITASSIAIVILSPILIPLMLLLKLTGEHYIFYLQERVGYRESNFKLIKFATMLVNSPSLNGGTITKKNDPRVLPFGSILRKTKINELPQLFNIFLGNMSIVGPRPQTQECFEMFPENKRSIIYKNMPGLTGIGSIVFRDEEELLEKSNKSYDRCYREDIMPYKAELEEWYLNNKSLWIDVKIIVLTAIVVICPKYNSYEKWFNNLPKYK